MCSQNHSREDFVRLYIVKVDTDRFVILDVDEADGKVHYSWDDTDGQLVTGLTNEQIRDAYGKVLYICDVSN